jgi:hypothetical protein
MVTQDVLFEKEYNCLTTDLVGGVPASTDYELGSLMYAWDSTTKELISVFKLVDPTGTKAWYKVV